MKRKITNLSEIFSRGVADVIPRKDVEALLRSGEKLRIKHGIDPTTPELHLGYAVVYEKLRVLQQLGHTVIFLVGDFTGRFGDPTGERSGRALRTKKEVRRIARNYLAQLGSILDLSQTEIRYNGDWYDRMKPEEFLRIFSYFTVGQMLERDMFQERMKRGEEILLHEPLYPALQAYDSVVLKSDLTVIGTDQTFNEIQARKLQERFGQRPQGIISMNILVGTDGKRKMSQSLGNYIGITEAPAMQFGKLMSIRDSLIPHYAESLTSIPSEEIGRIKSALTKKMGNPRDIKLRVARAIVARYHGNTAAERAEKEFLRVFSRHKLPTFLPAKKLSKKEWLPLELLLHLGLVSSKSEARRLIKEGAVEVIEKGRSTAVTGWEKPVLLRDGAVIRMGRRRFIQVKI